MLQIRNYERTYQSFLSGLGLSASGNVLLANALDPPFTVVVPYLLRLIFGRLDGCVPGSGSATVGASFVSVSRSVKDSVSKLSCDRCVGNSPEAVLFLWLPSRSSSLLKAVGGGASDW